MTLEELKIKMSEYPETRGMDDPIWGVIGNMQIVEEESGCESESVSSTLSQSGSSTDLADLATDEVYGISSPLSLYSKHTWRFSLDSSHTTQSILSAANDNNSCS